MYNREVQKKYEQSPAGKATRHRYLNSPKGIATHRKLQRERQDKYRQKWRSDPAWRERERAGRRKSYAKMANNPAWRKRKNEQQRLRNIKHNKDPKWCKKRAKQYKQRKLLQWLDTRTWTLEDYARMVLEGCVICRATNKTLVKDHDHTYGHARGLLCHGCNTKLGWYEKRREQIVEYLTSAESFRTSSNCNPQ